MKILFIRYKKSGAVLEGGEQASGRNHDVLTQIVGADNIDTYYVHDETRCRSPLDYLRGVLYFPFHYYFGLTPRRVRHICQLASQYDAVWVDRSLFGIIAKRLKEQHYPGIVIGFFHNVEVMYFDAKLGRRMPLRRLIIRCAGINDGYTCRYCDRIVALNERDGQELLKRYGRQPDKLMPITFADHYQRDTYTDQLTATKPLCLFIGGYFSANNEGIEWFVRNVYPHVDVRLRIVGKGMEKLQGSDWLTPDIELIPNAPDLQLHFEEADLMVLPIFKGGGMKVKTCESLMYGKNILATTESWEGYHLDYSQAGGLCNTADDYINRIREICQRPISKFNAYSRQVFLSQYSEAANVNTFRQLLETASAK